MSKFITRFAPSPTGLLHLGHAASALFTANWAAKHNADFCLRIEDIDHTRCKAEFETAIIEDLRWLGLHFKAPVRRQSDHMQDYDIALGKLQNFGLLYRCFSNRREVMAESLQAPHGKYMVYRGPKTPLSTDQEQDFLEQQKPFAWRLSLSCAKEFLGEKWSQLHWQEIGCGPDGQRGLIRAEPELLGDVILARKDIQTSYHLAVTHDDAAQGITHVIRGRDIFESTHIHVLLQALLDWPTPVYHHHALLLDATGNRLAKRDGATSLRALRQAGISAKEVRKMVKLTEQSSQ